MYHKLRLHGEQILKQMLDHLQTVRERRMLWSLEIIELNKRISDINDQDRMLPQGIAIVHCDPIHQISEYLAIESRKVFRQCFQRLQQFPCLRDVLRLTHSRGGNRLPAGS